MLKNALALFTLLASFPVVAEPPISRAFPVVASDHLAIGCASATIRKGPAARVTGSGPADQLRRYRVVQEKDGLKIGLVDRAGRCTGADQVHFDIVLPRLSDIAIGSARPVRIEELSGEKVALSLGGSSKVTVDRIVADRASLAIGGAGEIVAAGTARQLEASMAGSGTIDARALRTERAGIAMTGSGTIRAYATTLADATVMGSGSITVDGGARCSVSRMGSGRVLCR